MGKPQRIRDPVHGLIVFDDGPLDQLAWNLLNTGEFQRLRRIKQLGLSDFVFPGATHTRFAHCIGVFETARTLVGIIERRSGWRDEQRAAVAILAALLHDIGHGPLSHAFEQAQRDRRRTRRHEIWTAQIILDDNGEIKPLLEEYRSGISQEIADLLVSETPSDIYDSIVSSSFDADRLDYLRRDRLMTGTGAGAIDFDWLMENLRIETIDFDPVSDQADPGTPRLSLCLDQKALEAAETFLLARFHLYTQVYLHKATRAIGQMVGALLGRVATAVEQNRFGDIGLDASHPLARFYASNDADTEAYLALDDTVIWSAVQQLCASKDAYVGDLASRIRNRRLYKVLDIENVFPDSAEQQRRAIRRIRQTYTAILNRTVLQDVVKVNIYGTVGADDAQAQKRLMILKGGEPREITEVSEVVKAVGERSFTRFFFADTAMRDHAAQGDRE